MPKPRVHSQLGGFQVHVHTSCLNIFFEKSISGGWKIYNRGMLIRYSRVIRSIHPVKFRVKSEMFPDEDRVEG